jgi:hypothetical protein
MDWNDPLCEAFMEGAVSLGIPATPITTARSRRACPTASAPSRTACA